MGVGFARTQRECHALHALCQARGILSDIIATCLHAGRVSLIIAITIPAILHGSTSDRSPNTTSSGPNGGALRAHISPSDTPVFMPCPGHCLSHIRRVSRKSSHFGRACQLPLQQTM